MGSGLYKSSWTSLPTPFVSAQQLSKHTVVGHSFRVWNMNFLLLGNEEVQRIGYQYHSGVLAIHSLRSRTANTIGTKHYGKRHI
jgi:hypothetical protein